MKPIEITKQDKFGYERTFVVRHDEACGKMFLAEIDPDFGFESFRGVYGSMDAALDRDYREDRSRRRIRAPVCFRFRRHLVYRQFVPARYT